MKSIQTSTAVAALVGLASGAALTIAGAAFAHGGRGPHEMKWTPQKMEAHLVEMTQKLSLSEMQQATIRDIFDKADIEVQAVEDQPFGREKMLALRNIHFETEDALYATLSCEQREGLRQLKRAHRAERMNAHWQSDQDQNR